MFSIMQVFHDRLDHQQQRLVEVLKALSSTTEAASIEDYTAKNEKDSVNNFRMPMGTWM